MSIDIQIVQPLLCEDLLYLPTQPLYKLSKALDSLDTIHSTSWSYLWLGRSRLRSKAHFTARHLDHSVRIPHQL
jgi:hypothetical protein